MTTCLVCDLGGSSVKFALVDDQAQITESGRIPAPLDSKDDFVETIGRLYDRFPHVDGIAISIPGSVDPETGFLFDSGAYTSLYGFSISELLSERCPVPIAVENDGKCAALSEAWKGQLADSRDGAVIILGSGLAGGFIKDGLIHHGSDFTAGEISFLMTNPSDSSLMGSALMSCGMLGMTYKMCKAKNLNMSIQDSSAIIEYLDTVFHSRYPAASTALQSVKADGEQMFRWLAADDADVKRIYEEFIAGLAVVVHNIQVSYAPEKIVIGGGLSRQDRVLDDLRAELERFYAALDLSPRLRAQVVRSKYLHESNLVGAMHNYLTRFVPTKGS